MALTPGTRLGAHEILAPIGAGGMGEVYRARDTRLGRDVAIKISSEQFTERFAIEARAIASLNHPNICTLYDVGSNYLVMELVEGEALKGPLPLDTAIGYARQIAEGLEAAHEKGIVHRDLKPANIKVTPDGIVKLLDFGLAKTGSVTASSSDNSPTAIATATEAGIIMGTAAYMSPEQVKGRPVDKRSDIWAFGVVLYEMLTGRRLYEGETTQEILASILKEEPDLNRVPPHVRSLLRRCLAKDPKRRLRDIGDTMVLLEEIQGAAVPPSKDSRLWPAVAVLALTLVAVLSVWILQRPMASVPAITRFQIAPPPGNEFSVYLELSPDGRKLAFTAQGQDGRLRLWVRDMETLEARQLPGTEIATGFGSPFWSADSRFIAFSDGNVVKKVDAAGTVPAVTLTRVQATIGRGAWNSDGIILLGARGGISPLWQVSEAGGEAQPVTAAGNDELHGFPHFLPDGRRFLFHRQRPNEMPSIYVGSLDLKPDQQFSTRLLESPTQAVYVPSKTSNSGYLLYTQDSTLKARPFDPSTLTFTGEVMSLVERLMTTAPQAGYAYFSASRDGTLAYRSSGSDIQLTWFDRRGKPLERIAESGIRGPIRISRDGSRFAVTHKADIWVMEFARGILTRFTLDPAEDNTPFWSANGDRILFRSNRSGAFAFYEKPADGSGPEQVVLKSDSDMWPDDWSHDSRYILFNKYSSRGDDDQWLLPLQGERKPIALMDSPAEEFWGQFSPDDRWIAYQSNESGRFQVYVRPFFASGEDNRWVGPAYQVSKDGGERPLWRKDGKELVYVGPNGMLTAVAVTENPQFQTGPPTTLFQLPFGTPLRDFEMAPDGERFLIPAPDTDSLRRISIVMNWESDLKRK